MEEKQVSKPKRVTRASSASAMRADAGPSTQTDPAPLAPSHEFYCDKKYCSWQRCLFENQEELDTHNMLCHTATVARDMDYGKRKSSKRRNENCGSGESRNDYIPIRDLFRVAREMEESMKKKKKRTKK